MLWGVSSDLLLWGVSSALLLYGVSSALLLWGVRAKRFEEQAPGFSPRAHFGRLAVKGAPNG